MTHQTLYLGDAISVLRGLEAGSIDGAVFDPPYPTISGGSNESGEGDWSRPSGILTKNDGKIFDHNDVRPEAYLPELHRVLAGQAHVYLMTNFLGLKNGLMAKVLAAGFEVHNLLVWKKNNATPNRWYMKDLEYTIMARKGKAFAINNKGAKSSLAVDQNPEDLMEVWTDMDQIEFPYRLDHDNVPGGKRGHPTEKPVDLMKTYIENSTQPGQTVLDLFMGAGSTGVAAEQTGRNFVGIEIDPQYFDVARSRLPEAECIEMAEPEAEDWGDLI